MADFPAGIPSLGRPTPTTKRNAGAGLNLSTVIDKISDNVEAIAAVEAGLAGPNVFVDPAINVWVDGTTFTSIADGTWGPAGLIYRKAGAVVHDLLRSTDVPAVAATNPLANYSCHLDVTTADSSIAAGDFAVLATRIEGYDWKRHLDQRIFSFGFWVKAAKTGIHCVYARNSGNDRSCVIEYTVIAANTWEYKEVTFPAAPSAGTWNYTNGRGIEIGWTQHAGSTFQTTAGAWQAGDFYATANQVNESDNTANNFRIALLGPPTAGAFAAPFAALPISLEDFRTRRYNEVIGGVSNGLFGSGFINSTSTAEIAVSLTPKRATPTVAVVGTIGNLLVATSGSAFTALTSLSNIGGPDRAYWLRATVAGTPFTLGQGAALTNTAAESIKFSSRIP